MPNPIMAIISSIIFKGNRVLKSYILFASRVNPRCQTPKKTRDDREKGKGERRRDGNNTRWDGNRMKKVEDEFTSKEEEKEKDDGGMGKTPVDNC